MALALKFSRPDTSTSWGFRLVGGSDFDQPLVVVKVNENSSAEQAGLQVGDVIVRINNTSTSGLTHTEVHELISSVGSEFVLGVRRGDTPINIIHDESYNFEFHEIVRGVRKSVDEDIIDQATDIVEKLNRENTRRNQVSSSISDNIIKKDKMVFSNAVQTDPPEESQKWSTFLMKPDKPIPQPKVKMEESNVENDPYKVIIKKQGLRRKCFGKEKKVQFEQNTDIIPVKSEVQAERTDEDDMENHAENGYLEVDGDVADDVSEHEENNKEDADYGDENDNRSDEADKTNCEYHIEDTQEIKYKPLSEIKVDESSESSMTLEEQLLAVQKQLQTLSQLPSAIQMTLDAVSKQLASIVSAKESSQEREKIEEHEDDNADQESIPGGEHAEAEVTQEKNEDTDSNMDDELDEDSIAEEELKAILERAWIGGEHEEEVEWVPTPDDGLTEDEKETIAREEQVTAKKEKAMEDPPTRPKHVQRPIILPGGRKWSNPEDAMPTFRKPRMSEEKIIESIESNLETIIGKRKGINFLKYQPPPKIWITCRGLEVYRLVHDMEPLSEESSRDLKNTS
ncbi:hypothetical protein JTB14_010838 [Gonioctena quinquepunctata]|nr:hypothetical protein JTB14_010838 [Gonioctena quinquepunctata]